MKKWVWMVMVVCITSVNASSQTYDVQQLLLNLEKLSQFKKILQNMLNLSKIERGMISNTPLTGAR